LDEKTLAEVDMGILTIKEGKLTSIYGRAA
jgi:hypothetical protein